MTDTSSSRILNGVEQVQRLLPALEQGYFNVDEMSFEDLLTVSVEFASSLKFYNTSLQPSGDWKSFLVSNEIVIMAVIINKDIDELRKIVQLPQNQDKASLLKIIFAAVVEIDKWLIDLKRSNSSPAVDLVLKLQSIVRSSLLDELHNIGAYAERLRQSSDDIPNIDYSKLGDIWEIKTGAQEQLRFFRSRPEIFENESVACEVLRRSAFEFYNAMEHLKSICRDLLPLSLKTQSHDPAISLFITFLQLYKYAQDNVNSFTQRHLDYYYHEILKVHYKKKNLESVVLNFSIAPGGKPIEIDTDTKFVCARDDQLNDIVFCSANNLTVTDAEIDALYTLRFEREDMITPECDMNFVTRIHKHKVPLQQDQGLLEGGGWPLFGDGANTAQVDSASAMGIGVAIASRVLFLGEGYRKISLEVGLTRSKKSLSHCLGSLERSSSRVEFRQALFELLLAWMSDLQLTHWERSVSGDLILRLEAAAKAMDTKDPPVMISAISGSLVKVKSCVSQLENAIERIRESDDISQLYTDCLQNAESAIEFRDGLGRLVIQCLLEDGSPHKLLAGCADNRASELRCKDSLATIKKELRLGKGRLFKKYFGTAFLLELTTGAGWWEIDRYDVIDGASDGFRLQIIASLPSEAPPIVGCLEEFHGENWNTELPILKLKLNPEATINVYSLLERYCLDEIKVGVDVTGVRNIIAYNHISQLDPSKPFYPFGPLPTTSSYFAFSTPEAAKKSIDSFRIHLHWGDLPQIEDGFDGHYSGYKSKFKNQSFSAKVSILNNGSWLPKSSSQVQSAQLFSATDKRLKEHQAIDVRSIEHFRPIEVDIQDDELDLGLTTRNGFLKLTLASPDAAFGHQEYPFRVTETLESNSKAKAKKKKNIPNTPYTPLLNKVSIDYTASSTMPMNTPSGAGNEKFPEKVFRLHPFGAEEVYPNIGGGAVPLFKPYVHDGNFLLGVSASEVEGLLSIYFSLTDDSERNKSNEDTRHQWSYLTSTGWVVLREDRIIGDGTKGFLCSGIVTLDLPSDISKDLADMPGSYFWLKVSSNADSVKFCSLNRLKTHAQELRRSEDDNAIFDARSSQWSELQWESVLSIPGLEAINQLDRFVDVEIDEQRRGLVTRISERIRHRSRAVTPWDYERLILEKFPYVGKVLCIPNRSKFVAGTTPGTLLVVVTPLVLKEEDVAGKTPKLSAVFLKEIHEYISNFSSVFTNIEVSNPNYEWVQVRCAAVFEDNAGSGMFVEQLNRDIGKYLNPWDDVGYGLNFCQTIKREDIYSYIYNLDYIKFVTAFSMLHITRNNSGQYELGDTVSNIIAEGKSSNITPLNPWSMVVPMKRHYIEVNQEIEPKAADITGIQELEIGSTFIIGGV
jgi:hypothetical protein